ncbi:MAG TPA: isochorismatase family cysteine hydrolase [Bacteroidia bacterium]
MELTNETAQLLQPERSVVLLWDIQNILVNNIFNKEEFMEKNLKIIKVAREKNIPRFFSKITPLPERFESPVRKILFKNRFASLKQVANGFDLAISTVENDIVIPKHTPSMFIGTHFEQMLRNAGLTTIIITGIATEIGVESTARDASNRGFFPFIVSDAVSSFNKEAHYRSLENMKSSSIVLSSSQLIDTWRRI